MNGCHWQELYFYLYLFIQIMFRKCCVRSFGKAFELDRAGKETIARLCVLKSDAI